VEVPVPHLAPPTLTAAEQKAILRVTATNPRDHLIFSMALGTGLRLAELVDLNVGDVFAPDGTPRLRVRIRPEIAKGGRAADVFLPDRLVAEAKRSWAWQKTVGAPRTSRR
jgi:integrase/recombinase XerC